ncbi:hypothetical protein ISCGN_026807 [Ixodes scapularis]
MNMSWSDLDDIFLQYREPEPRRYKSSGGLLDVAKLDDLTFRRMFRFKKDDFGLLNDVLLMPKVVYSSQGVVVSGEEALLMCLRRLAYPNRWWDLEPIFGRHLSAMSSIVGQVLKHIDGTFGHLLDDLTTHSWLSLGDGTLRKSILRESGLYGKLEKLVQGRSYTIYGDPAYPLRRLLMRPYGGATLTQQQVLFNSGMSTVRQAVEWGFGKIVSEFAFLDFKKNQKLYLQDVGRIVLVDHLLHMNMSWSDLDDMFLQYREPEPRRYKSSGGLLDVAKLDDLTFRRMFRFKKDDFGLLNDVLLMPKVVYSSQGVVVSGEEALLMCLRRLAYPNRWWDLEPIFGRHSSAMSSIVGQVLKHIDGTFGHLLDDLTTHSWLSLGDGTLRKSILRESGLYGKLEKLVQGRSYTIYGDPAYPLRRLLMRPYGGATLTQQQVLFNSGMSTVRQAVEWGFGKIVSEFAFLDFKKNQKLYLQDVGRMYRVGAIFTNCHTCLYGSQTGMFFGLRAPNLGQYLKPSVRDRHKL